MKLGLILILIFVMQFMLECLLKLELEGIAEYTMNMFVPRVLADGTIYHADGSRTLPDGTVILPDGTKVCTVHARLALHACVYSSACSASMISHLAPASCCSLRCTVCMAPTHTPFVRACVLREPCLFATRTSSAERDCVGVRYQ